MSKRAVKKSAIGVTALALVTLLAGWLFGWFSEDPAIAEVRQMQAQLGDTNMKDTDRRALMDQIRTKMESFSPDVRRGLWENNRQAFENRMNKHVGDLLAMSKADRNKALDADIERMQKRQAEAQANAQNNQGANANNQRQGNRGQAQSDDQRVDRMKNRLDRSSPQSRAMRQAYVQMLDQRLKERGLPPMQPGGGGPRRG
jgi:hypothetical protein